MERLEILRTHMRNKGIEAFVISTQANIYYISKFYAEAGVALILVSQKDAIMISDGRFMSEAKEVTTGLDIRRWKSSLFADLGSVLDEKNIHDVYIDEQDVCYGDAKLLDANTKANIHSAPSIIEDMRHIKSKEELENIQQACRIADESFDAILSFIKPGITEKEVADELEFQMRKRGASTCSFETIVASGHRGALPHGVASEKILQKGDMATMDFGALYHHYCSDITRTICIGEVDSQLLEVYDIVKEAQALGAKTLKAGVKSQDLERVIREYIQSKGYDLIHGPGHSFGLEIHEHPFISKGSDYVFEENVVVTLEPGIYIPGLGGVRIEDDFLVTKDGCEVLTHACKDRIVLPF